MLAQATKSSGSSVAPTQLVAVPIPNCHGPYAGNLSFNDDLRCGSRASAPRHVHDDPWDCRRLRLALGRPPVHSVDAAHGARAALPEPRVHALRVEAVLAPRQLPAPVTGLERLEADRAVPGLSVCGSLEVLMARKRSELAAGQSPAAAVLYAVLLVGGVLAAAAGAEPPQQSPENDEDVGDEHHSDARDEQHHGEDRGWVGRRHAVAMVARCS